jgi:DNA polymerase-4
MNAAARTILHADMDAFYAAIEQRDRPELRGRPVVVGGRGPRSVVSTASYEARRFGVRSAMPSVEAERRCPDAVWIEPRMRHYAQVSEQIGRVFESFTPLVEPLSLDEAFLDVTGSLALLGDGETIAQKLKRQVLLKTGLTVSVGVASCKFVAKVASDLRKPDGLVVVPPGREAEFLAPLPVRFLWGAGRVAQEQLARAGLTTIGDVQRLAVEDLVTVAGAAAGAQFAALARGDDPRPVEPERDPRSIGHETTFLTDLRDAEAAHAVLLELAEKVGRRLRRAGLRAATLRLKLRAPDFTTTTRQQKIAPTDRDLDLYRAARTLLERVWTAGQPIRLLGIAAADLAATGAPAQQSLFGDDARQDQVMRALDSIRDRFGDDAIGHGS